MGTNFVLKTNYSRGKKDIHFFDFITGIGLKSSEVAEVLKLHPEEVKKLMSSEGYINEYAKVNLLHYVEAKNSLEHFMTHQRGFKNPEEIAEQGDRIPLEALAVDLGLVERLS